MIAETIVGSSGVTLGRNRFTRPSGWTRNFSKFQLTRLALPAASGVCVS
ncbi:hypothetical protein [Microbacterium sp.]